MTAAPHSPLVTCVARVLCRWRNGKKVAFPDFEALSVPEKSAYCEQAQSAIDACHAEDMLAILRRLTAPYTGDPDGEPLDAIINDADDLLAKLDSTSSEVRP